MTVDPDEILIFKLRGMKTKRAAKRGVVAAVPSASAAAPQPARARVYAPAPKPAAQPKEAEKGVTLGRLFKPEVKPVKEEAGIKPEIPKELKIPEEMKAEEEEQRIEETIEQQEVEFLPEKETPAGKAEVKTTNIFVTATGITLIFNALVFGYFVLPQSIFVANYIASAGLLHFLRNLRYDYSIAALNLMLSAVSALSGVAMLTRAKYSETVSGVVAAIMLVTVSFEYLTSSTSYLLIVSVITFISIVSLAYSRMSAVEVEEAVPPTPEEMSWPTLETF